TPDDPAGSIACQRVDPAAEVASLAGQDGGVAESVREERGALDAGEQCHGEVARVASAELPELSLGPVDDERDHGGGFTIEAGVDLVELGAERPHWAAVTCDCLAHLIPVLDERLEPGLRRAVALERLDQCRGLLLVAVEDGADQLVLALEVVVDVPERD